MVWNLDDSALKPRRLALDGPVFAFAVNRDGSLIAVAQPESLLLVSGHDLGVRARMPLAGSKLENLAFSDHGRLLAARLTEERELPGTGRIAGALVMFPSFTEELVLHKIMVHPDCRGAGIGSALMRHALSVATRPVLLTVDPDNGHAIALYRNFGFEVRERVDGYYRPHEDRLIMVAQP